MDTVKLQKQLSRKVKGKAYPKYVVAIPPRQVVELGWKVGVELEAIVGANEVLLRPKNEQARNEPNDIGRAIGEEARRARRR